MDPATRQTVFDDWQFRAEKIASYTEAVHRRNERGRLEQFGSGVLMQYGSLYCILSAAHVLAGGGERWLDGAHSRNSLSRVCHIGGSADAPPTLKAIDLAFATLSATVVTALADARFLTLKDVDQERPIPGDRYCVVGYANSDHRRSFDDAEPSRAKWTALGAKAAPADRYDDPGVSRRTHLLLDFDRQETEGNDGTGPAPKLNGMSGCGIWRLGEKPGADRLAAILTEYRKGTKSYIVGSRVDLLIGALAAYVAGELAPYNVSHMQG
jgi:hypothetical protein